MGFSAENAMNLGAAFTPVFMSQVPMNSSQYGALASQQDMLSAGLQAEAIKKASKKKKKSGIGKTLGTVGAVAAAPFTGGASLAYLPMAAAGGAAVDSAIDGDWMGAVTNAGSAASGFMGSSAVPAIDVKAAPSTPVADLTTGGQLLGPYSNGVGYDDPGALMDFGGAKAAPAAQAALDPQKWGGGDFNVNAAAGVAGAAGLAMLGQERRSQEEAAIAKGARGQKSKKTMPQGTHPTHTAAVNIMADTSPGDWRRIWRENPLEGYAAVQMLADKGVKLSREQVRAMPGRYRKMLRKDGVDVPEAGFERIDQFMLPLTAGLAAGYLLKNGNDGVEDFVPNF